MLREFIKYGEKFFRVIGIEAFIIVVSEFYRKRNYLVIKIKRLSYL